MRKALFAAVALAALVASADARTSDWMEYLRGAPSHMTCGQFNKLGKVGREPWQVFIGIHGPTQKTWNDNVRQMTQYYGSVLWGAEHIYWTREQTTNCNSNPDEQAIRLVGGVGRLF